MTAEVVSLRQKLADSQLTAAEKDKLVSKAAELAAENVALKASVDELKGQKGAADEKLRAIESDLAQRGSNDDVSVLRQELVSVQKMMDEAIKAKEGELLALRQEFDSVRREKESLQSSASADTAQLAEAVATLGTEKANLERDLNAARLETKALQAEKEDVEKEKEAFQENKERVRCFP